MHRDDFAQRGLATGAQTAPPFDVDGADVLVLDDVLFTGRTIRAVLNELFDYGRPASVRLAVLVDRVARSCPCRPTLLPPAWRCPAASRWPWRANEQGTFQFQVQEGLTVLHKRNPNSTRTAS